MNLAYITKGCLWQKRANALGDYRDIEGCDRVSLVTEPSGGSVHLPGLLSLLSAETTVHGNMLSTNVEPHAGKSANDVLWGIQTNSTGSFAKLRADVQPNDVTIIVRRTSGFRFRIRGVH